MADQADIVDAVRSGGTRGLVRGDVIVSLLIGKIKEEMGKGKSAFLLDGFPRNLEQDKAFRESMRSEFNVGLTGDYFNTPYLFSDRSTHLTLLSRYLVQRKLPEHGILVEKGAMIMRICSIRDIPIIKIEICRWWSCIEKA